MSLFHLSTKWMLAFAAVVAVNLTIGRALWSYHRAVLLGVVLTGPLLQVGLIRLYRDRNPFWGGMVVSSVVAMFSLFLASLNPFSAVWLFWHGFVDKALAGLRYLPFAGNMLDDHRFRILDVSARELTLCAILTMPQLVIALVGGIVGVRVTGSRDISLEEGDGGPIPLACSARQVERESPIA